MDRKDLSKKKEVTKPVEPVKVEEEDGEWDDMYA